MFFYIYIYIYIYIHEKEQFKMENRSSSKKREDDIEKRAMLKWQKADPEKLRKHGNDDGKILLGIRKKKERFASFPTTHPEY